MVMNGDAMGKSMQGAGGSLVMGVVMNSIMARSASNKRILDITPEKWLTDVYLETNSVFKTFNGTMVLSATVALIDDITGKMFYWNAEHPFSVLYRDETASFIEPGLRLRKLGLESEYEFAVYEFQMEPGDVFLLASDGRDDIDLTPTEAVRTINDDEMVFLQVVEEAGCDVDTMVKILKSKGDITDDLSFVKVSFQEDRVGMGPLLESSLSDSAPITTTDTRNTEVIEKLNKLYQDSKRLYLSGEILAAKERMEEAFSLDRNVPKLNKLYGLLSFKTKDYEKTVKLLSEYLSKEMGEDDLYYYLSIAHKKLGNIQDALNSALKGFEFGPKNISNIVNISDLFRIQGDKEQAKK
jgi:tetratricopeptide (TPR) repeat protein